MGCFDTVIFECPNCSSQIKVQSKGGSCSFHDYHGVAVPLSVAGSLSLTKR